MEKVFKIADIRKLDKQYQDGEISYTRMVELMNEMAHKHYVSKNKESVCPICGGQMENKESGMCRSCWDMYDTQAF